MVRDRIVTVGFYTKVKTVRSHADRMGMIGLLGLDSGVLLIVALATLVGSLAVWRTLAGLIDHATRLHDTQVRVVELQLKYLMRARAIREKSGDDGEYVVGEAGDPEV